MRMNHPVSCGVFFIYFVSHFSKIKYLDFILDFNILLDFLTSNVDQSYKLCINKLQI